MLAAHIVVRGSRNTIADHLFCYHVGVGVDVGVVAVAQGIAVVRIVAGSVGMEQMV